MCPDGGRRKRGPILSAMYAAKAIVQIAAELWRYPRRWRKRLEAVSVPRLLDEIEEDIRRTSDLPLAPALIRFLAKQRSRLTIQWRANRCLLRGMLLFFFLPRAGRDVTIHIGCRILPDGGVTGHCWISGVDSLALRARGLEGGMTEVFRRTAQSKQAYAGAADATQFKKNGCRV